MIRAELTNNRLTEKQIIKIVDNYQALEARQHLEEETYLIGKNREILYGRQASSNDLNVPDHRIIASYGRKIIKTVTGYMYKPGLINYSIENTADDERIRDIFQFNEEPILNQRHGTYQGTNGVVYELHYIGTDPEHRYNIAQVKASEGIAIYDHSIKAHLVAFIRYYLQGEYWIYEVYYSDEIITYRRKVNQHGDNAGSLDTKQASMKKIGGVGNPFGEVPVLPIWNDENQVSDIRVVKSLIDAYDEGLSDSVNELARFAWAYMMLFGMKIEEEDIAKIKQLRVFNDLDEKATVEFLTRDIPSDFIETLMNRLKREIHIQSFIPDLEEIKFSSGASGVAISKFIYLMEFIASDKQAYFESMLRKRFKLMNKIVELNDIEAIKITFNRNEPESAAIDADIYTKYDGRGISRETLMQNFARFVENPQEEMERFEEEQKNKLVSFNETEEDIETEEEDDDDDTTDEE